MKAIVYSKAQCGYCDMAKNLLEQKGIEFEEKRIDDNEHVGGYNELRNKLQGE